MSPDGSPKFVAVIKEVREVSLIGLADAACWSRLLRSADLQPARKAGKAQVVLSAVEARYLGVPFRELSLSVFITHPEREGPESCLYLAQAFNSSRLFALVERAWFRTPYSRARVEVDPQLPVSFAASRRDLGVTAWMAREGAHAREPIRCGYEGWEGRIFLPRLRARDHRRRRWFAARLAGDTHVYPFVPTQDGLDVRPSRRCPVLQLLADSGFAGQEWIVRESAMHARSKTYGQAKETYVAKVEAPALETPG